MGGFWGGFGVSWVAKNIRKMSFLRVFDVEGWIGGGFSGFALAAKSGEAGHEGARIWLVL